MLELKYKQLICTEPTSFITKDGHKCNGTLHYYIRPIQKEVGYCHEQQIFQLKTDVEWQGDGAKFGAY